MKYLLIIISSILFLSAAIYGGENQESKKGDQIITNDPGIYSGIGKTPNIRGEKYPATNISAPGIRQSLAFDGLRSLSPGETIATTTYDLQTNATMPRTVAWRDTAIVQFVWTNYNILGDPDNRYIGYYSYNGHNGVTYTGNTEIPPDVWSGFPAIDVMPDGRAVVAGNNMDPIGTYVIKAYTDYAPGIGQWGNYNHNFSPAEAGNEYLTWPRIEVQNYDNDTVIHIVSMAHGNDYMVYLRHVGSDPTSGWDPIMHIDTMANTGYMVVSSRSSQKVAIVWAAPPGYPAGSSESLYRGDPDPGLGAYVHWINDIYYMTSSNMGGSWGPKVNMTSYDSTVGGYLNHGDLSALIDSDDNLHIIWTGHPVEPMGVNGGLGEWPLGPGTAPLFRNVLFHWDDFNNTTTQVADALWDQTHCNGGGWSGNIGKVQISECDGRFYALWVQFNDIPNGIEDDCAVPASPGYPDGSANGELFLSVSDATGMYWDGARNLTNTYSPDCDNGINGPCESDNWASMSKFGMNSAGLTFPSNIVDPSGSYGGDYFLDVVYINDQYAGAYSYGEGEASYNPVKWFRLACVEPEWSDIVVTHNADDGPGSFRQAIIEANSMAGPNRITFTIGLDVIYLDSELPALTDDETTIEIPTTAMVVMYGSYISGTGLTIQSSYNEIVGNEFGLHLYDFDIGMEISGNNNSVNGCWIRGSSGDGLRIVGGNNNLIQHCLIYNNEGNGITILSGIQNTIDCNYIYTNGGLAIDLGGDGVTDNDTGDDDSGPNNLLNFPEITSWSEYDEATGEYTVEGTAPANATVKFYLAHRAGGELVLEDPTFHGEMDGFMGSVQADGTGIFTFVFDGSLYEPLSRVTALATDADGNTSELCHNFSLYPPLKFYAYSPVNLRVTDPNGDYIGRDSLGNLDQTIADADYPPASNPQIDSITIHYPLEGAYTVEAVAEAGAPEGATYSVGVQINGSFQVVLVASADVPEYGQTNSYNYNYEEDWHYLNGDPNRDDVVNILDITSLISFLYQEGPAPEPYGSGDANCDLTINIIDITKLIGYLYQGDTEPCNISE